MAMRTQGHLPHVNGHAVAVAPARQLLVARLAPASRQASWSQVWAGAGVRARGALMAGQGQGGRLGQLGCACWWWAGGRRKQC